MDVLVDEHGLVDVFSEDICNIELDHNQDNQEGVLVKGGTLNAILRACVEFLAHKQVQGHEDVPDTCWKDLIEITAMSATVIATAEAIMDRMRFQVASAAEANPKIQLACFQLLHTWVVAHAGCISMEHFIAISQQLQLFPVTEEDENAAAVSMVRRIERAVNSALDKCTEQYTRMPLIKIDLKQGTWDGTDHTDDASQGPHIEVFGLDASALDGPSEQPPVPRIPVGVDLLKNPFELDILDLDPKEVARQMSLIDHELFTAIPLHTFFGKAWSKPRYTHKANEIRRFIDRFNATSLWAVRSVLQFGDPRSRAECYVRLVKLAVELEQLNNFSSLMAIVSGLRQACITRMSNTLAAVGQQWQNHVLRLQQIMSESRSYSMYRQQIDSRFDAIQNAPYGDSTQNDSTDGQGKETGTSNGEVQLSLEHGCTGIVPHLGVHLQDLTFIEDGNPEHLPDKPYMINLVRLRMVCGTIKKLKAFQGLSYTLEAVRQLQAAINFTIHQHVYLRTQQSEQASKQLFERSKQLEPTR